MLARLGVEGGQGRGDDRAHLGQGRHGAQVAQVQRRLAHHQHQRPALLQRHVGGAGQQGRGHAGGDLAHGPHRAGGDDHAQGRNEPEAIEAPTSASLWTTSARPVRSSADEIRLLRQGQQGGAGDDQVAFDAQFAAGVQHAQAVDHAGRAGNSDHAGGAGGFRTAPFTSWSNSGGQARRVRTITVC